MNFFLENKTSADKLSASQKFLEEFNNDHQHRNAN